MQHNSCLRPTEEVTIKEAHTNTLEVKLQEF